MAKIAISFINDLQDARYCAAMNCAYVGFCIDAEQSQYISPAKIRETVAWLSGPQIIVACGKERSTDLAELEKTLSFTAIKLAEKEWDMIKNTTQKAIYLSAEKKANPTKIAKLIEMVQAHHSASKVIVNVDSVEEALTFAAYFPDIFLHFSSLMMTHHFLQTNENDLPFGIYIEGEGYLADGGLNYELLDEILNNC